MAWPPPFDCAGAEAGACRLFELLELLDELELSDGLGPFDGLELSDGLGPVDGLEPVDEPPEFELEPVFAVPPPAAPPEDEVPVPVLADELPVLVTAAWVEPGSTAATAPAATTLAKPTVAVAAFSLRFPRSRSATACETWRAAARARADAPRSSQLSILAVCHA